MSACVCVGGGAVDHHPRCVTNVDALAGNCSTYEVGVLVCMAAEDSTVHNVFDPRQYFKHHACTMTTAADSVG